jgi:hypothetical protein
LIEKERKRIQKEKNSFKETKDTERILSEENSGLNEKLTNLEKQLVAIVSDGSKNNQQIDDLKVLVTEQNKILRQVLVMLGVFIVCISGLLLANYLIAIWGILKIIITAITGLGGLWSFVNMILNLKKAIK